MSPGGLRAVLIIALVTFMLGAAVAGALYQREIGIVYRRLKHRVKPPPEPPSALTIERIARNARRLRAELTDPAPGTPMARRISLTEAYDDLLADACQALDVPYTLSGIPPGIERDAERLRVETELTAAGLRLTA